jgi:hypothetical protein
MSDNTAESVPSLAHPLFVNSGQGVGKDENEGENLAHLPPFPDVDLINWQAFAFSHLHWIGMKLIKPPFSKEEAALRMELGFLHENFHDDLTHRPFSQLRLYDTLDFYRLILTTAVEGKEQIDVPLKPDQSGSNLQKRWADLVNLIDQSRLVEEVFAIRSSLLKAKIEGLIGNKMRQVLLTDYKKAYGNYIPLKIFDAIAGVERQQNLAFPAIYDAFDFVARKLGEAAALGIIFSVFETLYPSTVFLEILFAMCKVAPGVPFNDFLGKPSDEHFVWNLSEKATNNIATLSPEQAYHYFRGIIYQLDPNGSRYHRTLLLDSVVKLEEGWNVIAKDLMDDFVKFLVGIRKTFLFSTFSRNIHPFSKIGELTEEVVHGNFIIFIEAIRQQLTHGMGLLCPFWMWSPGTCCHSLNREVLEKIWYCTKPNQSCRLWERLGCLKQETIAN